MRMRNAIASRSGEPKVESHPIDSPHTITMIPMKSAKADIFIVMAISLANIRCCEFSAFVASIMTNAQFYVKRK